MNKDVFTISLPSGQSFPEIPPVQHLLKILARSLLKRTLNNRAVYCLLALIIFCSQAFGQADTETYLSDIKNELTKKWPHNRTINLVFHGHSVPTGYFATPDIRTLEAYPHLTLEKIKSKYTTAAVNVITTSIGGENSEQGQKRFKKEVLVHRPDVLFIDYALNDRGIGLERSKQAMEKMIKAALKKDIKIILLTPSPDLTEDIADDNAKLQQYTQQIIGLARQYNLGLADSYGSFKKRVLSGEDLKQYMAQSNHPNKKGHEIIAEEIAKYFF